MDELVCIREAEAHARIPGGRFIFSLDWEYPVDLDLAALLVPRGADPIRLVYRGDTGARQGPPWAKLTQSINGRGRAKHRRERIVVTAAEPYAAIHLFAWDHDAVATGGESDFSGSPESYELSIIDSTNGVTRILGREHPGQNCVSLVSLSGDGELTRTDAASRMRSPECQLEALLEMLSMEDVQCR